MAIYTATDSRTFNDMMNALASTRGVQYSPQWPIDVDTGRKYLTANYAHVGRVYARQLMQGNVGRSSTLSLHIDAADLSNYQRALLTYLADTQNTTDFDNMMRVCIMKNALPSTAGIYFSKTRTAALADGAKTLLQADLDSISLAVHDQRSRLDALSVDEHAHDIEMAPAAMSAPSDARLNAHDSQAHLPSHDISDLPSPATQIQAPAAPAIHVNGPASAGQTVRSKHSSGKRRKASAQLNI